MIMLVGRYEGYPACIKLGVYLLVVTIWLEICTYYSSAVTTTSVIDSSNKI